MGQRLCTAAHRHHLERPFTQTTLIMTCILANSQCSALKSSQKMQAGLLETQDTVLILRRRTIKAWKHLQVWINLINVSCLPRMILLKHFVMRDFRFANVLWHQHESTLCSQSLFFLLLCSSLLNSLMVFQDSRCPDRPINVASGSKVCAVCVLQDS